MMPSTESRKASLRARLKSERSNMDPEQRRHLDAAITDRVLSLPAFQTADALFSYRSFGSEVDTSVLIDAAWQRGMTVALPRCDAAQRKLIWQRVERSTLLVAGTHGIEEPNPDDSALVVAEGFTRPIALVPGLAFDRAGNRLGYGGGYYDRFLPDFPGTTIGIVREPQLFESLRAQGVLEDHDAPVDMVVWDGGVLSYGYSV